MLFDAITNPMFFITACLALAISPPSAPLAAGVPRETAVAGEIDRLLDEQTARATSGSDGEFWNRAVSLRATAESIAPGAIDSLVDQRLGTETKERPLLFLASVRLQGADPDASSLFKRLTPLLSSPDDGIVAGAAAVLADPHFKELSEVELDEMRSLVSDVAEDARRAPNARLDASYALFVHGDGQRQRLARSQMRAFLSSSDPSLRALGALQLARTGAEITGVLLEELERVAAIPGEQGQLAASYLKQERIFEEMNRRLKRIQNWYEESPPDGPPDAKAIEPVRQFAAVVDMVKDFHLDGDKVDDEMLLDAALDGMLQSLDEHSTYFAPDEFTRFEQSLEGAYGGIGAYVQMDRTDSLFTITRPIYSGPAYRAGLVSDDKIVRIDDWSTLGQPLDEIIKRLKGKPGTQVRLYVWRSGMDLAQIDRPTEDMIVEIEREAITIPPIASVMLPGDIALVELREFSRVATVELRQEVLDLRQEGMRALVLDLRNDPGGLLDEAASVLSVFLPKDSLVVRTESRVDPVQEVRTLQDPLLPAEFPVAVLINRFSASASEIVAGALQDYGRADIVGERSFGKGSVQHLRPLKSTKDDLYEDENKNGRHDDWERLLHDYNGNGEFDYAPRVKLTVAKYLLPSGRSIHRELDKDLNIVHDGGVVPDREVRANRIDTWRREEMYRIARLENRPRGYAEQHFSQNTELFADLAQNDHRDPSHYPGFEEFYASLNTPLPRDDVRALLRGEIRRRIQDQRGREFPQGDYVEDLQVQDAIAAVLEALGKTADEFEEYAGVFLATKDTHVNVAAQDRLSFEETLREIAQARKADGRLTERTLARLSELLEREMEDTERLDGVVEVEND